MDYQVRIQESDLPDGKITNEKLLLLCEGIKRIVNATILVSLTGEPAKRGRRYSWLDSAPPITWGDIQSGSTTLVANCEPFLGTEIENKFRQSKLVEDSFFSKSPFQLLIDVFTSINNENYEADILDKIILKEVAGFGKKIFSSSSPTETLSFSNNIDGNSATFSRQDYFTIQEHIKITPDDRIIPIVGTIKMVDVSSGKLRVESENKKITATIDLNNETNLKELSSLLDKEIFIKGEATFKPSGSISRVRVINFRQAAPSDYNYQQLSIKFESPIYELRSQKRSSFQNLAELKGTWPGDETQDIVDQAIKDLGI